MTDEMTKLIEELDRLQGVPSRRSLTKKDDLVRITGTQGSLTDLNENELSSRVKDLERHLDSMLGSIQEFQGFLSRTKGRI